jgi:hypothetical protein
MPTVLTNNLVPVANDASRVAAMRSIPMS